MSDLKPCPFCGGLPTVYPFAFGGAPYWGFRCCLIDSGRQHKTRESAVERWNMRAAQAPQAGQEMEAKDAARYRALRESLQGMSHTLMPRVTVPMTDGLQTYTPDGFDAAIDWCIEDRTAIAAQGTAEGDKT